MATRPPPVSPQGARPLIPQSLGCVHMVGWGCFQFPFPGGWKIPAVWARIEEWQAFPTRAGCSQPTSQPASFSFPLSLLPLSASSPHRLGRGEAVWLNLRTVIVTWAELQQRCGVGPAQFALLGSVDTAQILGACEGWTPQWHPQEEGPGWSVIAKVVLCGGRASMPPASLQPWPGPCSSESVFLSIEGEA